MSNNEFYAHKRSDKIKWAIAFILIAVLLAGMIGAWVMLLKEEAAETPAEAEQAYPEAERSGGVVTEKGEVLESGEAYPLPERMAFTGVTSESMLASGGVTVEATVQPQDATNREVDWTLSWANPASSWASGKTVTDYVTVTPTEDGALTATVRCLQAFGEQIRLTVTSRDNPNATASTTVDYYRRATTFRATFTGKTSDTSGNVSFVCEATKSVELPCYFRSNEYFTNTGGTIDDFMDQDFAVKYEVSGWQTGTVNDDSYEVKATLSLTEEIKEEILAVASNYGKGTPATALDGTMDASATISMGYNDVMKYLCCYGLCETEAETDELVLGAGLLGWVSDILPVITTTDTPFLQIFTEAESANTGDVKWMRFYIVPDKDYLYVAAESVNIASGGELIF